MAEVLIWIVGTLATVAGIVVGRMLGRVEGKRAGREEAYQDALHDQTDRLEEGRKAVRDGRVTGDPADRLRNNDGAW